MEPVATGRVSMVKRTLAEVSGGVTESLSPAFVTIGGMEDEKT